MVTFDDLPLEIHLIIMEQALSEFSALATCAPRQRSLAYVKAYKEFIRAVLRIATPSRSLLTSVFCLIKKQKQQGYQEFVHTRVYGHGHSNGCTKGMCHSCSIDNCLSISLAMRSLQRVIKSPTEGVKTPRTLK